MLAKGSDVPLTAGTPMVVTGPQLPGYVALPGRHMLGVGGFKCHNSTMQVGRAMGLELGARAARHGSCLVQLMVAAGRSCAAHLVWMSQSPRNADTAWHTLLSLRQGRCGGMCHHRDTAAAGGAVQR